MRKRIVVVLAGLVALVGVAGLSLAAGARQYQFTGTITEFDAKAKTVSVDKAGDVWEFSTAGLKKLTVKKGEKVTVYYTMTARKIEAK